MSKPGDENLVLDLERERLKCMHDLNISKLGDLLHDQFSFTHNNGMNEGKSEFLDRLSLGKTLYAIPELEDVISSRFEDCVILAGRIKSEVKLVDTDRTFPLDNRFTSVWVAEGGRWRAAAYQSTPKQA